MYSVYLWIKMIKWGWSGMSHDAALAVMDDDKVVYASHGERYSRIKNDKNLHQDQINEALEYGYPDKVYYYEKPWLKKCRQLQAGQTNLIFKQSPRNYLKQFGMNKWTHTTHHHHSHAAYGYYTSGFDNADILVIDSIGEYETLTYWQGSQKDGLKKITSQNYPHSVGLWYSAMTQRLGLKPQEHEYILMGMAASGDPNRFFDEIANDFFVQWPNKHNFNVVFKQNLHRGCQNWRPDLNTVQDIADIAAATQLIYEEIFFGLLEYTQGSGNDNLVIVGGCALNCVANYEAYHKYKNVWVPPNPGDAGSSLGSILAHNPQQIDMPDVFLGTDIPGNYPIDEIINDLLTTGVSAVASGRAEFGPRALGNRSILADPRLPDIKDRINKIKQRESFRPFAPAVLEEYASQHFYTPHHNWEAPYMQYAVHTKTKSYPGIMHIDHTSRVQTVGRTNNHNQQGFRDLLECWHKKTGCPMLLNTSLNIKGEPLVNSIKDAQRWTDKYGLTVRTPS